MQETITNVEYHSRSAISNSRLKLFMEDPRLYYHRYISGEYVEERKDAFDFGTAVHSICLEGDRSGIAVIPDDVLSANGAKSGGKWKSWLAEHNGEVVLKQKEYDSVMRCVDAVTEHPEASRWLQYAGEVEQSFTWHDDNLDMPWQCRVDKLVPIHEGNVILDLKTTSKATTVASSFVREVCAFGYHYQEYLYRKVLGNCGIKVDAFLFIAVSKLPPYTVDVYRLDPEFLVHAGIDVEDAAKALSHRMITGDWGSLTRNMVVSLRPPNYLKYQGEYDV